MTDALEEARRSVRLAAKQVSAAAQGAPITDNNATGDADLDERRLEAITELGRPLNSHEVFNLAAGRPYDYRPPVAPPPDPGQYDPHELPEDAIRRKLAAKLAAEKDGK